MVSLNVFLNFWLVLTFGLFLLFTLDFLFFGFVTYSFMLLKDRRTCEFLVTYGAAQRLHMGCFLLIQSQKAAGFFGFLVALVYL